ncbi:unnamed protein product [Caenorhabditis auriculariae]|uniref:Uncharacterized protein n=1 Tax=Caenorhabditis auriculariae TaxID=2777116 RepID=A0A8S1HD30_9PELO|nr:unnamed protein product [Caenorhabditis auriculariae]
MSPMTNLGAAVHLANQHGFPVHQENPAAASSSVVIATVRSKEIDSHTEKVRTHTRRRTHTEKGEFGNICVGTCGDGGKRTRGRVNPPLE